MTFESGVLSEEWRSAVIVSLYKGKGKRNESENYRGITLLNVVGKIYAGILVAKVLSVTCGLNDDEYGVLDQEGGVKIRSLPYSR